MDLNTIKSMERLQIELNKMHKAAAELNEATMMNAKQKAANFGVSVSGTLISTHSVIVDLLRANKGLHDRVAELENRSGIRHG